jgi:uncharacterized protein YpmB
MLENLKLLIADGMPFLVIGGVLIIFSLVSLVLFITKIFELFKKKPEPPMEPVKEGEKDVAEVIKGGFIMFEGKKLKYFLLNGVNKTQEKLSVGSKVQVLKKSNSEAYVKPI